MSETERQVKFMPGCFDHFEGTQEELDKLQQEIIAMFTSMPEEELMKIAQPIEDMPEELMQIPENRNLQ